MLLITTNGVEIGEITLNKEGTRRITELTAQQVDLSVAFDLIRVNGGEVSKLTLACIRPSHEVEEMRQQARMDNPNS